MKLRIAVHKKCKNKQSQPARDWQNIEESLDWLMGWVSNGYGWVATHFRNRHRRADNAAGSNMVVIDIDGDTVTIDGNHPLAGVELHFSVEVSEIREATKEEIEQGQIIAKN